MARAGLGIVYGLPDGPQLSRSIADSVDNFRSRSNQRAELLAAIIGFDFLAEAARTNSSEPSGKLKDKSAAWIIATDSEYIDKRMTEWLPKQVTYGQVTRPMNLGRFLALDVRLKQHEAQKAQIRSIAQHETG
jgi:ribonuclease HI